MDRPDLGARRQQPDPAFHPDQDRSHERGQDHTRPAQLPDGDEELASINDDARKGPLIVNRRTGLPYRQWYYRDLWHTVATAAGIERTVWNRDLRAGGITEAREAGAPTDDVAKTAGHSDKRTTARVYDRDRLEAARRVATARTKHRAKNEP
jgi:integrase